MLRSSLAILSLVACLLGAPPLPAQESYTPAPENLAARGAFQDDKFGIFIHWGVYSVLGRGEWVMHKEKMTVDEYEPLAEQFNPVNYDPDAWCKLFKQAGAKYVTITSKHHDGFAMWDSKVTDWDIVDRTPYARDVLKPLAQACREHGLKLYFYHSHLDWRRPDYYPRGRTGGHSGRPDEGDFSEYIDFMNSQLTELLSGDYGDVAGIWFDGWWDQKVKADPATNHGLPYKTRIDWRLDDTYSLIHRLQPQCLVGSNHHVAPFPGEDFQMFEKDLPGQNKTGFSGDAVIGKLPLETCDTINRSWGYNAGDKNYKSTEKLIGYLAGAAGRNANLLLNVGPKPDGTIDSESAKRLLGMGEWLKTHGDSIYGTRGGPIEPQDWGVSTHRGSTVYLHVLQPPKADADGFSALTGAAAAELTGLTLLNGAQVESKVAEDGSLLVRLPKDPEADTVIVAQHSR